MCVLHKLCSLQYTSRQIAYFFEDVAMFAGANIDKHRQLHSVQIAVSGIFIVSNIPSCFAVAAVSLFGLLPLLPLIMAMTDADAEATDAV